MRAQWLRFFLSSDDQDRIQAGSVTTEDVAYRRDPQQNALYPQSLTVNLTVGNPAAGAPELRPIIPGRLTFVPTLSPLALPDAADVEFTPAAYSGWPVYGSLRVDLVARQTHAALILDQLADALSDLVSGGLPVAESKALAPTVFWYHEIHLSQRFLFETIAGHNNSPSLRKGFVMDGANRIRVDNANWGKHAIAQFLRGRYNPELRWDPDDPAQDDAVTKPMPLLSMNAQNGMATISLTAGSQPRPQDGGRSVLDTLAQTTYGVNVDDNHPSHPRHAIMPARHALRGIAAHLLDAARPVAAAVLAGGPQAIAYQPIVFTRTWDLRANASVHFPAHAVHVENLADHAVVEQRLSVNGLFYLTRGPGAPAFDRIRVAVPGLLNIDGRSADVWRLTADLTAKEHRFSVHPVLHIQLRRSMSDEVPLEPAARHGGWRCTYYTMRRSMRALVNNRIAGGRLSFGVGRTSRTTRDIIDAASPGLSRRVRDNRPSPALDPDVAADSSQIVATMEAIMEAFFPHDAPAQDVDGDGVPDARATTYSTGEVMYRLWQTIVDRLIANATRANFANHDVCRGGAGALAAAGLGVYHVNPGVTDPVGAPDLQALLAARMSAGLRPGAVLQYWNGRAEFDRVRQRQAGAPGGHSPIFEAYDGPPGAPTALLLIDQSGRNQRYDIHRAAGAVTDIDDVEIWIAANWVES